MMKYFLLILKHKWFVFLAGLKIRVPLYLLVLHDWTKFLPSELPHYQRQFFGSANDPRGFIECWLHHQNHNKHHWEYWIPRTGHNRCDPPYKDYEPLEMPEKYVREMFADWAGASRTYEGRWPEFGRWKWWNNNISKIEVHYCTRGLLGNLYVEYFKTISKNKREK